MGHRFRATALLIIITISALLPVSARASSIPIGGTELWEYDGATAGCSDCDALVTFQVLSESSLKISFENTSTDGLAGINVLTGIGFNTGPELSGISILWQEVEGGKVWKLAAGVGGGNWEISLASRNGINNGLDNQSDLYDSGWIILGWTSPFIGAAGLTIDASIAKFQAVGPYDASIHANGIPTGTEDPPPVPVPEPSSLVLLATGVGVAIRRHASQRRTAG